jgi:hypothetical protein
MTHPSPHSPPCDPHAGRLRIFAAPVHLVDEAPVSIQRIDSGVILVDFGRVAFGNIQLIPPANSDHS